MANLAFVQLCTSNGKGEKVHKKKTEESSIFTISFMWLTEMIAYQKCQHPSESWHVNIYALC